MNNSKKPTLQPPDPTNQIIDKLLNALEYRYKYGQDQSGSTAGERKSSAADKNELSEEAIKTTETPPKIIKSPFMHQLRELREQWYRKSRVSEEKKTSIFSTANEDSKSQEIEKETPSEWLKYLKSLHDAYRKIFLLDTIEQLGAPERLKKFSQACPLQLTDAERQNLEASRQDLEAELQNLSDLIHAPLEETQTKEPPKIKNFWNRILYRITRTNNHLIINRQKEIYYFLKKLAYAIENIKKTQAQIHSFQKNQLLFLEKELSSTSEYVPGFSKDFLELQEFAKSLAVAEEVTREDSEKDLSPAVQPLSKISTLELLSLKEYIFSDLVKELEKIKTTTSSATSGSAPSKIRNPLTRWLSWQIQGKLFKPINDLLLEKQRETFKLVQRCATDLIRLEQEARMLSSGLILEKLAGEILLIKEQQALLKDKIQAQKEFNERMLTMQYAQTNPEQIQQTLQKHASFAAELQKIIDQLSTRQDQFNNAFIMSFEELINSIVARMDAVGMLFDQRLEAVEAKLANYETSLSSQRKSKKKK